MTPYTFMFTRGDIADTKACSFMHVMYPGGRFVVPLPDELCPPEAVEQLAHVIARYYELEEY